MAIVENTTKKKLEAGQMAIAFSVVHWRMANVAGIAKECGYDWLFIDMEHNTMDVDAAVQISVAALPTGITPIVRVPAHEHFHATRVLDGGAQGVVVPHVNTVEQARQVVENCKYPPIGHRSLTAPMPQLGFRTMPVADAIEALNRNTLVVAMLETPQAVDNADVIAAVEGIDALLIGTNDLAAEMGIPGQFGHARVEAAYAAMIAATRKHGKFAGMGGVYDHALMEKFIRMGVRLLLGGGDVAFMMAAARTRSDFLKSLKL
ncbi:HpcH/HpaI aldolase family protein [Shumkonia mesophila]|uniref:HpcH/HpaI aldolase family protein n=1 Tax=Shumkonia mesophila TaxID=2838854 RepID=UPI0029344CD6|nr:aldolase/citrate lyase family protein [Shumkonia mesophila]